MVFQTQCALLHDDSHFLGQSGNGRGPTDFDFFSIIYILATPEIPKYSQSILESYYLRTL